jgi:hypothetical protein
MTSRVLKAQAAYSQAAQNLRDAVKRDFPVGAAVRVTLGRSIVAGIVVSSGGAAWSNYYADEVQISNNETGKLRKFQASEHSDAVVLSR